MPRLLRHVSEDGLSMVGRAGWDGGWLAGDDGAPVDTRACHLGATRLPCLAPLPVNPACCGSA